MFEDLIKEKKETEPSEWEKGFYYTPYIPMIVIDCKEFKEKGVNCGIIRQQSNGNK